MNKKFAIIGAAGYVAPRHMKAINSVGGELVAALDPHDSVGILDSVAPGCLYFREPERFERWLLKNPVDYVSICSPNYLHDSHCIMAMRAGANVICEKPLVLREKNIDMLHKIQDNTGKKVNVVLQCRLHKDAIEVKRKMSGKFASATVEYITPRGPWYAYSWKGDVEKSGGLATNIGIHLFDLCVWLFGKKDGCCVGKMTKDYGSGFVEFEKGAVKWVLSTVGEKKREFNFTSGRKPYSINLVSGFDDLHNETYRKIISGDGFGIEDIREATKITEAIRAC